MLKSTTAYPLFFFAFFILLTPSLAASDKILYIASYHTEKGEWTAGIKAGIDSVLQERDDIILKTHNMDTRLTKSEEVKIAAALKAREVIESWKPDLVITSDDNAAKYLIMPYFKESPIPFVFCGLNWDASVYGLPYSNTTGMIEVQLIRQIIEHLTPYAHGKRIGSLRGDTLTNRKEQEHFEKQLGVDMQVRYVTNLTEWKSAYEEMQKEVDMLVLGSLRALDTGNVPMEDISRFVSKTTIIPTAAYDEFMQSIALVTLSTVPEEQGQWAAEQALKILDGVAPAEITLVQNKKARRILNLKLARVLGIKFPLDLLESSRLVSGAGKKVLYINSYHRGYKWSDDIEKGLLKALQIVQQESSAEKRNSDSNIDFKTFRMNTKLESTEEQMVRAAQEARMLIDSWQPDVVVASDDNAAKYIIQPYYLDASLPIVFCGINYDAGVYGLPSSNSTGMVEVEPIPETLALLKQYTTGEKVGYIGSDDISNRKSLRFHKETFGIHYTDGSLVSTFEEWQKEYTRLQKSVDMLIIFNPVGIEGWDAKEVSHFILTNTSIPSGAISDSEKRYSLLGYVKIAEEQGWWAGKTVLQILNGTVPSDIPVTRNRKGRLYINMPIANSLGITIPVDILEQATLLDSH